MISSHTEMFRSQKDWRGTPHPDNGKPDNGGDAWYFAAVGPDDIGGRLTGYVTREQFKWLASRLGVSSLSDEPVSKNTGEQK